MGNFGFWTGIGAAQKAQKAASKSTDGKSTERRHEAILEIVAGIFLALLIAAGVLILWSQPGLL
jgi:hypothetical protein